MSLLSTSSSSSNPSQVFSLDSASTSASSLSINSQSRKSSQSSNASTRVSDFFHNNRHAHYRQQQGTRLPTRSQSRLHNGSNVSNPPSAPRSPYTECFQLAMKEFTDSIGDQEHKTIQQCKTAEQFHEYITKMQVVGSETRLSKRLLGKISSLSSRLEPYFKVVEIFLQTNPRFAAFGWGAFRLVLQLASNYNRFFEKLLRTINRTGSLLPQFDDVLRVWKDPDHVPDRVRETIAQIFVKLMHFFHACLQVFMRKDGKIKPTTTVMKYLLWNPFEEYFEEFQSVLKDCQDTLRDEIALANLRITVEVRNKQEEARKERAQEAEQNRIRRAREQSPEDAFIRQAKTWLNPPTFSKEFEEAKKRKHEGTSDWIFDDGVYNNWKAPDTSSLAVTGPKKYKWGEQVDVSRFLWISGIPGCGKTVLCASIIDELKEGHSTSFSDSFSVLYFFFNHESEKKQLSRGALSAVLSQLLQQNRGNQQIIDILSFAMSNPDGGQNVASQSELQEMLCLCLSSIRKAYLIFDGVDECSDGGPFLEALQEIAKATDSDIRFLLLGRGSAEPFYHAIPKDCQLVISKEGPVRKDIRIFLEKSISDMVDDGALVAAKRKHVINSLSSQLDQYSNGMFLWARLVIDQLKDTHLSPDERLATIMSVRVPQDLDSVFRRILARISKRPREQKAFIRQVFMWLTFKSAELSLEQLRWAINTSLQTKVDWEKLTAILETWSLGLVEVIDTGDDPGRPQFVHLSVTEFFREYFQFTENSQQLRREFPFPCSFEANLRMASTCLTHLIHRLPRGPLSEIYGMPLSKTECHIAKQQFLPWAVTGWTAHLAKAADAADTSTTQITDPTQFMMSHGFETLVSQLQILLSTPDQTTAWIEALYVFDPQREDVKKAPRHLRTWTRWLKSRIYNQRIQMKRGSFEDGPSPAILELAEKLTELTRTLQQLASERGDTLYRQPHLIWSDITQFIKSPFLVEVSNLSLNVAQTPTDSELVQIPGLAPEPLAEMSQTSASKIGILRIFPSRAFVENQHSANFRPDEFSGWFAIYDIRTASNRESQLLYRAEIALDAKEVQDALDMAMIRADVYGGVAEVIRFPLSIGGPDLSLISVLRNIYRIRPVVSDSNLSRSNATNRAYAIPIFTVPKTVSRGRFLYATEGRRNGYSDSKDINTMGGHNSTPPTYEYELLINPLGTIVVLQEAIYVDTRRGRCKLSGFSLENRGPRTDLEYPFENLVYETNPTCNDFKITVTFSTKSSMAAFYADGSVQMWEFQPGTGSPNKNSYKLSEYIQLDLSDSSENSVSFSDCGSYLTVQYEMPGTRYSAANHHQIKIPLECRPPPNLRDYLSHSVEQLQIEDRPDQTDLALYDQFPPNACSRRPGSIAGTEFQNSRISSVMNYESGSSNYYSSESLDRRVRRYSPGGQFALNLSGRNSQIGSMHDGRRTMNTQLLSLPTAAEFGAGSERRVTADMNRHNLRMVLDKPQERYYEVLPSPRSQRRCPALQVVAEKDMREIYAQNEWPRTPEHRRSPTGPTPHFFDDSRPLTVEPVIPPPSPTTSSYTYSPVRTIRSRTTQQGNASWRSPPSTPNSMGGSVFGLLSGTRSPAYSEPRQRLQQRQFGSRRTSASGSSWGSG